MLDTAPLPIITLILLLIALYHFIIYPRFISTLRHLPTPPRSLASISPLWITLRRRRNLSRVTLRSLHQTHGPIVRLAPTEVSVNSLEGLKAIYLGGYERHPWYLTFRNYDKPNLVSQLDSKLHSAQKRLITNVYSRSFLQRSPELHEIGKIVLLDRLIPILDLYAEGEGKPIDVLELAQCAAMDMISTYIFGSKGGTNFLQDVAYRHAWFRAYDSFKIETPKRRRGGWIEQSCLDMCHAAEAWLEGYDDVREERMKREGGGELYGGKEGRGTKPVVYEMFSQRHRIFGIESPLRLDREVLASELLDHLVAGHESTGISLMYALYELSRRSDLQAKLREEVGRLPRASFLHERSEESSAETALPDSRALDNNAPFLEAILTETFRLHQAVPQPQPRVTPKLPRWTRIAGYDIPAGTKISCNAYTLHRNEDVFEDPETWIPERWIACEDEKRKEMRRWLWTFSSGGKMCLGSNFAIQELKQILAVIYARYTTEIVHEAGIEQTDEYVAGPVGGKLVLKFKPVLEKEELI